MIPPFRHYLFDVDGTLLDSAPDINAAVREVLSSRGRDLPSDAYLRSHIGRHLCMAPIQGQRYVLPTRREMAANTGRRVEANFAHLAIDHIVSRRDAAACYLDLLDDRDRHHALGR